MFVLSKLLSAITQPLTLLACLCVLGLAAAWRGRPWGLPVIAISCVLSFMLGFQAIPDMLLRELESQFQPPADLNSNQFAGMVVLGGATGHPSIYREHGQVPLGEAAERMTLPTSLMQQHLGWTLVFSGGEGHLHPTGVTEAELARAFWVEQGVPPGRLLLEDRARNTRENALFVANILGPRCKQHQWLLVTSAFHMPRAMAEFNAVGCRVTPYPVDYRTNTSTPWYTYQWVASLSQWQIALHEAVGIAVYGLTRDHMSRP